MPVKPRAVPEPVDLDEIEELLENVQTVEGLGGVIVPPDLVPFDSPPEHAFTPEPTTDELAECRVNLDILAAIGLDEDEVETVALDDNSLPKTVEQNVKNIRTAAARLPTRLYLPEEYVTPESEAVYGQQANPALLGAYPVTLPIEVAMGEQSEAELAHAYRLQVSELRELRQSPRFMGDVKRWQERLSEEGMSFRIKAAMMSEKFLETVWAIVRSEDAPANVRADLIKWTADVAGNGPKRAAVGDSGPKFALQINLGGRQPQTITVEGG